MLRVGNEFETTPLDAGFDGSTICLGLVAIDDYIGCGVGVIGSAFDKQIRLRVNLNSWDKINLLHFLASP